MKRIYHSIPIASTIFFFVFFISSCTDEEEVIQPTLTTGEATSVGLTVAKIKADIPDIGSQPIEEYGIVYSSHSYPSANRESGADGEGGKIILGSAPPDSTFYVELNDLKPGTQYHYTLYTLAKGSQNLYTYGHKRHFKTLLPRIDNVTPNTAWPGDTVLLEGLFFSDTSHIRIRFKDTEGYYKDAKNHIVASNEERILLVVPAWNTSTQAMDLIYEKTDVLIDYGSYHGSVSAVFSDFEIHRSEIIDFYPKIGVGSESTITIEVSNLNPSLDKNLVFVNNSQAEVIEVTKDQIKAIVPVNRSDSACSFPITIYNGALLTQSDSTFTYGLRYTVEDEDGNQLSTIRSGDLVVFKIFNKGNLFRSRKLLFGDVEGKSVWSWALDDGYLLGVQVPENLPLGKIQIQIMVEGGCLAITDSNTEIEVVE